MCHLVDRIHLELNQRFLYIRLARDRPDVGGALFYVLLLAGISNITFLKQFKFVLFQIFLSLFYCLLIRNLVEVKVVVLFLLHRVGVYALLNLQDLIYQAFDTP